VGLDFHGVIDVDPKKFSELSKRVMVQGGEVHIITGSPITEELRRALINYGIYWTHLFSITDYHKSIKTPIRFDEAGNPWIEETAWDRTKGDYCREHNIDLHIDDSDTYGNYFDTPYLPYISKK
jgi:hypothetical protein